MRSPVLRFFAVVVVVFSLWTATLAQSSGYDTSRMDRSANACDDFFQYANGTWLKNTEIPASQSRWGSFNILNESNRDVLHDILENAAKQKAPKGSDAQLIGDFYASCMDEAAIEKAGLTPLQPYLKRIESVQRQQDIPAAIAWMHKNGIPAVFRLGGGPDPKNSNMVIINAGQSGLSLPDRDYYTKTDERSVATRVQFTQHMTNMFKLLGDDPATAAHNAQTVMDIQTRLANASKGRTELRDREKNYNKIPLTDAQKIIPNLDLAAYMKRRGIPAMKDVNFGQPEFFAEVNKMLTDVSVDAWKTYFRWMLLNSNANALPKGFVDESFDFQSRYLQGVKEQLPRWKRCVAATNGNLGEAVGAEYIKVKYTPEAEARMDAMITNLFAAMKTHIENVTWMGAETKQKALEKLAAYKRKIGYNKNPRGYKRLKIDRRSYAKNGMSIDVFELDRNVQDIGKPTDRTRWGMSPPTVNASYNPNFNDITFPAGILQPPFFNFKADDAINYGGIGAVIGHEISHGFDDQGSKSDPIGNLVSWWTADDRKSFEERADCVVRQFNGYEVQPGLNINGKLTLGENIGDLGGLAIAYTALENALAAGRPGNIDGFTPEQRFFLGWAQVWAMKSTPEAERLQALTDPHSAARWRVNGPLSNMQEFAHAFQCKTGDRMVREKFCQIW
jgi:putative endopeptidase